MKKLAIALALGASMVSVPALAAAAPEPVSGDVIITGSVAPKCQFTNAGPETIDLTEMAATDGTLDTTVASGKSATLRGWCNKSTAMMSVDATQLTHTTLTTFAPGFVGAVTFSAQAEAKSNDGASVVGTAQDTNSVDAANGTAVNVGMFHGDIVVTLSNLASATGLLAAGDYEGHVKVTLSPAL